MEKAGYKFAGYSSPSRAIFRFAAAELAAEARLEEQTVFSAYPCHIVPNALSTKRSRPELPYTGTTFLQITRTGLVFDHDESSTLPLAKVLGYIRVRSGESLRGGLLFDGSLDGSPAPMAFVFHLTEFDEQQFSKAMAALSMAESADPRITLLSDRLVPGNSS